MDTKANLFLVGAMKAGTTSLSAILDAHDEIYLAPIKEPHFFAKELPLNLYEPSRFFSESTYFKNRFPEPIHIAHVQNGLNYERLFEGGVDVKYRLDASTGYLHAPGVASRIHAYNPNAKIIIITRDPIARAFSHYKMDKGLGRTKQSFAALINEELQAYHNGNLRWNSYLGMSCYNKAIDNFQVQFKSVLVLDFDTFIKNREQTLLYLSNFLEVDDLHGTDLLHKNRTRALRFQKLFYFLKKSGLKDYFSIVLPKKLRHKLFGMLSTEVDEAMQLSPETLTELQTIFRQESP